MAWSRTRDPFAEQNIQNTNILLAPAGKGVPVSSKEFNTSFLLRSQAEQELLRSLTPSGFLTRLLSTSTVETTTTLDQDGELVALTTSNTAIANTIRLGRLTAAVNGWKITVSNVDGTNGLHNNITLDAAPTSGGRTDLVFLEVWVAELGGSSASITNTTNKPSATTLFKFGNAQFRGTNVADDISEVDAEVNRRWQIQYRLRVVNGVDIDTYPAGIDHTAAVKAWGANASLYVNYVSGSGTPYTFTRLASDPGLYVAGDGSSVAKSAIGSVDGYSYAIPVAAIFRRNTAVYDAGTNPLGCALSGGNGNIASGISGRPDGYYYDQVVEGDILSLRHQCLVDASVSNFDYLASDALDRILRGSLTSQFGRGDGSGAPAAIRSTNTTYAQELSTVGALDAGFKGFAEYNTQRRIFSDVATCQQTHTCFTGGAVPDNALPTTLTAPATPTGSVSTVSGTLAAATYYVKITYTNAYGETLPSVESTGLVLGATGQITVNSPIAAGNASGWNAYITTTSGSNWRKQNGTPTAIGTGYTLNVPLNGAGATAPANNTSNSTLTVTINTSGLQISGGTVTGVDGVASAGAGNLLPGNKNLVVYNANTGTEVTGTWAGLGTPTATFTVTVGNSWAAGDTTSGVVVAHGLLYPAGNGMNFMPNNVVGQTLIQGGNTYNLAQIGVSGVTATDDAHLNAPRGVFVDASGNVFVADTKNHRVIKYNSSFVKQAQFGVTGTAGADNTHLSSPTSVIVDSSNNVYVSDTNNHRIVKLSSSLTYAAQFGTTAVSGSTTTTLNLPYQICFDNTQANIFIADSENTRIIRITNAMVYGATPVTGLAGKPLGVIAQWDGTYNQLHIAAGHAVYKYTTSNGSTWASAKTFGTVGTAGATKITLNSPSQLWLAPSYLNAATNPNTSHVWVGDAGNSRIVELSTNYNYVAQLGITTKTGVDKASFNGVSSLCTDTTGLLYLADTNNHRILKMHKGMGMCDNPLRQFEVLYPGASTDRLKVFYNYRPYQGVIASQGAALMNYTLRGLTDLRALVTTLGTGGRNAKTSDALNGCVVRLPLPFGGFGSSPSTNETEYKFTGADIALSGDSAGMLSDPTVAWGGKMDVYQPSIDPLGNEAGPLFANGLIKISQNTLGAGYPFRGVNTIQRYNPSQLLNAGWENLGLSFGTVTAVEHLTFGYFLATASGGTASLPLIPGEVVLCIVSFRHNSTSAAIYGHTNVATAVDIFRLPSRPLLRY